MAKAAKEDVAAKLKDLQSAKAQMNSIAKATGIPITDTPTAAPSTPGTVSVMKDASGNFYKVDASGAKTPITRQDAQQLYQQQNSSGSSSPTTPSTDTSNQGDSGNNDQSSVAPAATAGAYASAQPPAPAVPPDPQNATPQIGAPDPNNPQLAA
jgi:hypothetical protein